MGKRTDLAGVLTDSDRHVIHAVVEDLAVEAPKDSVIFQLMPITTVPAATLEHETIAGSGGLTQERVLGEPGKSVSGPSSTSNLYEPGSYQDVTKWGEKEILRHRKFGTLGDRGVTGLTDGQLSQMEMVGRKHKRRLQNRLAQLAWDSIFTGQFTYKGRVKNFGIPANNTFTAASDWSLAGVGTPFEDLITLLDTDPFFIKYRPLIQKLVINPVTAAHIMLRALESKVIINNNITSAGINEVKKFMAPGLPDFEIVADAWQDETEAADGSIVLGSATRFVPDRKILPVINFDGAGVLFPKYGELQLTENMNDTSATVEKPAVGIYTFIDEEGLTKRKSPYVELVSGFNGGPNLMRNKDVIIIEY